MSGHLVQFAYLVATALFVFALHWMNTPATARRGVYAGVIGMTLAVVATWARPEVVHHLWIVLARRIIRHDMEEKAARRSRAERERADRVVRVIVSIRIDHRP